MENLGNPDNQKIVVRTMDAIITFVFNQFSNIRNS